MATRLEQDAKRRTEKKPALFMESTQPRSNLDARLQEFSAEFEDIKRRGEELRSDLAAIAQERYTEKARGVVLWDEAVESLGRSAGVLEKLAESAGEAIARMAARGDRIDRTQKETRALMNALVAPEADA